MIDKKDIKTKPMFSCWLTQEEAWPTISTPSNTIDVTIRHTLVEKELEKYAGIDKNC